MLLQIADRSHGLAYHGPYILINMKWIVGNGVTCHFATMML